MNIFIDYRLFIIYITMVQKYRGGNNAIKV